MRKPLNTAMEQPPVTSTEEAPEGQVQEENVRDWPPSEKDYNRKGGGAGLGEVKE